MTRKQGKKTHLASASIPVEQVSTSANTEESPEPHIEVRDLPDKHRRTSVLITGGDEALPHNKSIDDSISSTARKSACFTDDRILRKNLVSEGTDATVHVVESETTSEKKPTEPVKVSDAADDAIEPNQFEDAIKKNKLDFKEETPSNVSFREQSVLSPKATEDTGKQLGSKDKGGSGQDISMDKSLLGSHGKNDIEEKYDFDPITSVGDKHTSELQECFSQVKGEDEEVEESERTQEKLARAGVKAENATQDPPTNDSEMKGDDLPLETEPLTSNKLPWETDETKSNAKNDDELPGTVNTNHQIESEAETNLPWETEVNHPTESASEDKLPWETVSKLDDRTFTTSETDDGSQKENEPTNVEDLFEGSHNNDFFSEIQKQEDVTHKDQTLAESLEDTTDANQIYRESAEELNEFSTEQSAYSKAEEKLKLKPDEDHLDPMPNQSAGVAISELKDSNKMETNDDIDKLFENDDQDFLHGVATSSKENDAFTLSPGNGAVANAQEKFLDFLELDDNLLDDEFLDDDTANEDRNLTQSKKHSNTSQNRSYGPTTTHPITTANALKQENLTELALNKKKNDAYDFPDNLLAHKFNPATRSTNKYASNSSTPRSPPASNFPQKFHSTTMNDSSSAQQSQINSPSTVPRPLLQASESSQTQQKKSFFEDLPMPIQKQPAKPARAALPKSQVIQNISPTVYPAHPQLLKPIVNPYAKPATNTAISSTMNYTQSSIPPSVNNRIGSLGAPNGMVAQPPPPPPSQIMANNNMLAQYQPQSFPNVQNQSLGLNANSYAPARKISNPSPNTINTALPKVQGTQGANSPYVPNAGPYAPSSHKRTLSRASSLIGVKSKEINPYAPASVNSQNSQPILPQGIMAQGLIPNAASPTTSPAAIHNTVHGRRRGISNVKSNFYHKEQVAPKVENPNALLQRQFPIFNWSSSKNVVYLVPSTVTNTYNRVSENINVNDIKYVLKDSHYILSFPGPLNKLKTKKKDVENWIESYNEFLLQDNTGIKQEELMLCQILLALVKHNGDVKSNEFSKDACVVLNPNVDYTNGSNSMDVGNSLSVLANAYKLDNAGINIIWGFLQVGNTEKALEFCLSKGDWALALMIASFDGPEKFGRIASDYARTSFPYQKSQSKVHHLMPIMLKLFAGNFKSAIDDITNVQSEGEWSIQHWRELVSLVVINKPQNGNEFLCEFSKFLALSGNIIASQICLILAGLPLSNVPSQINGVLFSVIGFGSQSFLYSEIYEYSIQLSTSSIPPTGFPHLLPLKLKHAQVLADYGLFTESQKYGDAISTIIKAIGRSSFFNPVAFQEFQNLLMRISQSGPSDLGWFGSKKLNLDKMWDQLDKFIGGDESKSKSGENGVFSKFSPSVSRAPSSLDVTTMHNNYPQTLPHVRADHIRDNLVATNYAPAASSDSSVIKLNGMSHSRPPPSLYSNNSTTSILKYAPSTSQVFSKPGAPRNDQVNSSPQQVGNLVYESLQQSRMIPSNSSSLYLPFNQNQNENANPSTKLQSKHVLNTQKMYSTNNSSFPYLNPSAQFSNLSIASHQSLHMGIPAPNPNSTISATRPSITNSFSENHVTSSQIPNHKHSSSLHSDISLDYPAEFKSIPKHTNDISMPDDTSNIKGLKKDTENIPETINESKESEQSSENKDSSDTVRDDKSTFKITKGSTDLASPGLQPSPPPSKSQSKPDTVAPYSVTRKARNRANPYAPGTVAPRTGSNKYGLLTTNKYLSSKKEDNSLRIDTPSDVSYDDIFNYGGYQVHEKAESNETKDVEGKIETSNNPQQNALGTNEEVSKHEPVFQSDPNSKFARVPQFGNANVDDSFDNENLHDGEIETSSIHTRNPNTPSSNKLDNSFRTNEKESMFYPYQENNEKLRRISNFGVDSSFGDFPIPGSPDLTTRANSVIGGAAGLFSSRLSQSQQSALYQQYEVQDDTVKDYIPVVDEEDEDSEDESLKKEKKEKKKKEEQERERRIAADEVKQRQDATGSQRHQKGWFSNLLGNKNDDKPKPIRAKLGDKSSFVYDEKLKRWINKDIPIEEQLKSSAPPPPPAAKRKPIESSISSISRPSTSNIPCGATKQDARAPAAGAPSGPSMTRPSLPSGPAPAGPGLANAGLDDLLSLGGGQSTVRKAKKGPRRGYVNLLDQK